LLATVLKPSALTPTAASLLAALRSELEMLRVAAEMREERVRMKLAEARVQVEEKNAVVDRLRQELEAFLGRDGKESPARDEHRVIAADDGRRLHRLVLASEPVVHGIDRVALHKNREDGAGEVDESDGSDIELNVDGNSRDYSTSGRNATSRHGSFSGRGTGGGRRDD
jgi:hypothetical protein